MVSYPLLVGVVAFTAARYKTRFFANLPASFVVYVSISLIQSSYLLFGLPRDLSPGTCPSRTAFHTQSCLLMWPKNLILVQNLYIFTKSFYRHDRINDKKLRRFLFLFSGGGGEGGGVVERPCLIFWRSSYETPYETRKYLLFQILGLRHRYGTYNIEKLD